VKKHYTKLDYHWPTARVVAMCDPLLEVPSLHSKKDSQQLTREQVLAKLDMSSVCTACKRIAVVERLNGAVPDKPGIRIPEIGRFSSSLPNLMSIPKNYSFKGTFLNISKKNLDILKCGHLDSAVLKAAGGAARMTGQKADCVIIDEFAKMEEKDLIYKLPEVHFPILPSLLGIKSAD
jgi:hypothetical protein